MNILNYIKSIILSKSFLIFLMGFLLALAAFSRYIFGNDNLLEQLGEYFVFMQTGKEIDFSPENGNSSVIDAINTTVEAVKNANK
jgi:hypothetical protein